MTATANLSNLQEKVYKHIRSKRKTGSTDFETQDALGFTESRNARTRRQELVDYGLVIDSGKTRKNPNTGRDSIVWTLNPLALS